MKNLRLGEFCRIFFYFDGLDEDTYAEVSQLLKDFAVEVFAQKPSDASLVTGS